MGVDWCEHPLSCGTRDSEGCPSKASDEVIGGVSNQCASLRPDSPQALCLPSNPLTPLKPFLQVSLGLRASEQLQWSFLNHLAMQNDPVSLVIGGWQLT